MKHKVQQLFASTIQMRVQQLNPKVNSRVQWSWLSKCSVVGLIQFSAAVMIFSCCRGCHFILESSSFVLTQSGHREDYFPSRRKRKTDVARAPREGPNSETHARALMSRSCDRRGKVQSSVFENAGFQPHVSKASSSTITIAYRVTKASVTCTFESLNHADIHAFATPNRALLCHGLSNMTRYCAGHDS